MPLRGAMRRCAPVQHPFGGDCGTDLPASRRTDASVATDATSVHLGHVRKQQKENRKGWVAWIDGRTRFFQVIEHGPKEAKANRKANPVHPFHKIENPSSRTPGFPNVFRSLFGLGLR